jgi:DNA-directed RNA polymerase specialized sigma24 family protein
VRQLKQVQRRLPVEQIMELVRQYEAGASASELAKTFGVDQSTVHRHLKRQGTKPRPYRKLRGEQLEEAVRLHASGMSIRGIARELGINRGTVSSTLKDSVQSAARGQRIPGP